MKKFLFLYLVSVSMVLAQNTERKIRVMDSETQLPIEEVTVYVAKTKQLLQSNKEGEVSFVLAGLSNLQFSHPAYHSKTLRSSIVFKGDNVVYLKSNVNKLDELVVTRQHPQKILKALVKNSIEKLSIPARLKIYNREFFALNGVDSYYTDGLLNFQLSQDKKEVQSTILVEQNRSFGLVDQEISKDLLGYNLNNIITNYYAFSYLNPILDPKAKDSYYFLVRSYAANEAYYMLTAAPLDNAIGVVEEFKVVYDVKNNVIVEVSGKLKPNAIKRLKSGFEEKEIFKSDFKTTYRFDNNNYYLLSAKEEIGFEKPYKKEKKTIEVKNYLITNEFSNQHFTYREPQVFKDKALINKGNSILTNYWDFSGLTTTDEEQAIIARIANKM